MTSETREPSTQTVAGPNPFVGPRPFQRGERLFGRLKETRELYYLLTAERIVWLHSPSGAGKTSLVSASLVPRLARDGFVVCPTIRVNLDPPPLVGDAFTESGNRYLRSLVASLDEGLPTDVRRPLTSLSGRDLPDALSERLAAWRAQSSVGTLLVFDQFEEILTTDPLQLDVKLAFFQTLGRLLRDPGVWALFVLRGEYLAQLEPYVDWIPTRWGNTFRLDMLGESEVLEVLSHTAEQGGRTFTEPAARTLFADLARTKVQQPDGRFREEIGRLAEPVQLQVVCRRLWDAMPADDLSIDREDLIRFGDVSQALGAYYGEAISRIAGPDRPLERQIRAWFGERLITSAGIRGLVLRGGDQSEGLANSAIAPLLDTHLIRAEQRAGATWYELAHDRLIAPVLENNATWLEAHLEPFQRQAALWVQQGRPPGGGDQILPSRMLKEALAFQQASPAMVSEDEARLIDISRGALRTRRWSQAAIAVIVLMSLAFAVTAVWWGIRSGQQERAAWYQVAIGHWKDAVNVRDRDPLLAAHHFARAAERFADSRSPEEAANARLALKIINDRPLLLAAMQHDGPVSGAVWSPDQTRILTWSQDWTARIWDSRTGEALTSPLRHQDRVYGAQFSPDQTRVLTWSWDGTARVWDGKSGEPVTPPLKHEDSVYGAVFSSDGSRVLTRSGDGTARVWDSTSGQPLTPPLDHGKAVRGAWFSADETRIFTEDDDGSTRVWDSHSGDPLTQPLADDPALEPAESGADESPLRTSGIDWITDEDGATTGDRAEGLVPTPAFEHDRRDDGRRSSADGSRTLVWGRSGTARVWDNVSREPLTPPLMHGARVRGARFSDDEMRILTWGDDDTARVWLGPSGPRPMPSPIEDWAPGDRQITSGEKRTPTGGSSSDVESDHAVDHEPGGHALPPSLKSDQGLRGAQLSSDGTRVLTWSDDGSARVWSRESGAPLTPRMEHKKWVTGAEFSPDESRILTWSADRTARVWRSASGTAVTPPLHHEGAVTGARFSADASRILTWSNDRTARVWDSRSGASLTPPLKHQQPIRDARFSADGTRVLTWGEDGPLLSWDIAVDTAWPAWALALRVEAETGVELTPTGELRVLSPDEWGRKRWCEYDSIRQDLGRLSDSEWVQSQGLCRLILEHSDLAVRSAQSSRDPFVSPEVEGL